MLLYVFAFAFAFAFQLFAAAATTPSPTPPLTELRHPPLAFQYSCTAHQASPSSITINQDHSGSHKYTGSTLCQPHVLKIVSDFYVLYQRKKEVEEKKNKKEKNKILFWGQCEYDMTTDMMVDNRVGLLDSKQCCFWQYARRVIVSTCKNGLCKGIWASSVQHVFF